MLQVGNEYATLHKIFFSFVKYMYEIILNATKFPIAMTRISLSVYIILYHKNLPLSVYYITYVCVYKTFL